MIKLSAVIITFNEEGNIARCLQSLEGVADEIIVVDSYSTDKTAEICKTFNIKFILHPFEGHIQQKNYAVTQASHGYILSLDADEVISPTLRSSIINLKKNWERDGYEFNRLTNYCGKWIKYAGWYPDTKLRLWRKGKGQWGGTNPHDKMTMEESASVGFLNGDLFHYSYHSVAQHISQINYFSDIAANEAFLKGKRASLIKIVFSPFFVFIKKYFYQGGFTGGWIGFTICTNSAFATFSKYTKLRELSKNK